MTKIDLAALEHNAKSCEHHRGCCDRRYMEIRPAALLALTVYIRELEAALRNASSAIASYYEDQRHSGQPIECAEAAGYERILERGAVLP